MGKEHIASVTYENEMISMKNLRTLHKMCVTSLLCGKVRCFLIKILLFS